MKNPKMKTSALAIAALATTAGVGLWATAGSAQGAAGPFNAKQVEAGRSAYIANCVMCHGNNMSGEGEAPSLSGRAFMAPRASVTTKQLFDTIKSEMPFGAPGSLSDEAYTNLVAFILHANGAKTGTAALTPTTDVKIASIANGTVPGDVVNGVKAAAPAQTAQAAPAAAAAPAAGGAPARPAAGPALTPAQQEAAAALAAGKTLTVEQLRALPRGVNGSPQIPGQGGGGGGQAAGAMPVEYTNLGVVLPGDIKNYSNITDDMLKNPSPNDWLMYRGNYAGWSYSSLDQINNHNVNQLQMKWSMAMNDGGTNETTPLIHDGVMYLWETGNTVVAINAVTGELLWRNNIGPAVRNLNPGGDVPERSMALYQDKVIVPTMEQKIYALDARTGKIVWQTYYSDPKDPLEGDDHGSDGGVIVINGKVEIGMTFCGRVPQPAHCYISAYDANTGKRVWKFFTVADKGQPGGDTWNGLPNDQRAGAETWNVGTYDPVLNTVYWGTAQSKPWRRDLRGSGTGATLYANSTLALDPDTGKLKWYFVHEPGETFDLDEVFERILVDHGAQKTVMTTGKAGILWKLDRTTGKYLDSRETVFQNVYDKMDPKTGVPTYRKDVLAQQVDQWLPSCPGPAGGKDWPAASYSPLGDTMVIPLEQSCVLMNGSGAQQFYEMPGTEGNMGRLSAYETGTMKPLWSLQQRSPFLTGVVTTAGGVAFVGDYDRTFHAFDTKTGKQLWTTRLGTGVEGHISSFAVNGKQYIAVMAGLGGSSPQQKPDFILNQEVHRPNHGNAVYVFALPDPPLN